MERSIVGGGLVQRQQWHAHERRRMRVQTWLKGGGGGSRWRMHSGSIGLTTKRLSTPPLSKKATSYGVTREMMSSRQRIPMSHCCMNGEVRGSKTPDCVARGVDMSKAG